MRAPGRYLAAALAELPDEDLAAELGCPRAQRSLGMACGVSMCALMTSRP